MVQSKTVTHVSGTDLEIIGAPEGIRAPDQIRSLYQVIDIIEVGEKFCSPQISQYGKFPDKPRGSMNPYLKVLGKRVGSWGAPL
jgi:hypothetical protein